MYVECGLTVGDFSYVRDSIARHAATRARMRLLPFCKKETISFVDEDVMVLKSVTKHTSYRSTRLRKRKSLSLLLFLSIVEVSLVRRSDGLLDSLFY